MIVLVGHTRGREQVAQLQALGWGRMVVERRIQPYPGEPYAIDNGAFVAWRSGQTWDASRFLHRVDEALRGPQPYLCVAPDRVAAGMESFWFSLAWLAKLPAELPWYLAVQDGMIPAAVEAVLPRFAGLFLGGSDAFKASAGFWSGMAHAAGKRFHYARAGTLGKLARAGESGADSCDSAFPLWTKTRMRQFAHAWRYQPQGRLPL